MNMFVVVVGLIELTLSLLLSVLILFLTFKFFHFITKKIDDIKELKSNNYSVALYNASILFAVAWVAKSSINGAISSITLLIRNPTTNITDILKTSGIVSLQIVVSVIIAFSGIYISLRMFMALTKNIDEFKEIKNNNVSIAIILSAIVIIVALFIEPSVKNIIQGLVPYPKLIINPALAG